MKKILGILLALCFVLSVTAASAAAGGVVVKEKTTIKEKTVVKEKNFGHGKRDRYDDHNFGHGKKFNDHHKKRHHHPAHWENKRVCHKEHRHDGFSCVYVYKMFYVAEYYDYYF